MLFSGTITQLGCGKVAVRAQAAKINTAEETKAYLTPENTFWTELGEECASKRIAVDLFITIPDNKQMNADLATISPVSGLSGGDLNYYCGFDATNHGEKLYFQMFRIFTRPTASQITMKMRTSTGMTCTDYLGTFMRQ